MKKLFIARHAKSSWDDFTIPDYERPLLSQGVKRTEKVIKALINKGVEPDLIISSTAKRAKDTALMFAKEIGYPEDKIDFKESFYHAYDDEILAELYSLNDDIELVMVVGHNPALTDLVNQFSKNIIDNLPTSAVAAITFKTNKWNEIGGCKYDLDFILRPSEL